MRHPALARRLRAALADGQLHLEYQPKADMRSGRIVGVEALARWSDPELGLVAPGDFVPSAERDPDTIAALTEWSIDAAVAQAAEWLRDGTPLTMAVNLSPRTLLKQQLTSIIGGALERHGLPPSFLQLELTETALFGVTDPDRVTHTLCDLSEMDLLLALDDFGTGYSSLARLRDMPIDKVKIDKSFVSRMDDRPDDALIVRGVIALSKSLGLRVVAEGVESEPVWRRLSDLGCDVAQGNYLSPPLPAEELIPWVAQWQELFAEAHRMAEELLERRTGPDDRRSGRSDRRRREPSRRFARADGGERAR